MKELLANIWIIIKGLGNWFIQLHNADLGPIGDIKDILAAIPIAIGIGVCFWKWLSRND